MRSRTITTPGLVLASHGANTMRTGTLWHSIAASLALAILGIGGVAWACDLVPPPVITRGILGSAFQTNGASELVLPRNFAIVEAAGIPPMLDDGTVLAFQSTELRGIARVGTDVAPGSTITSAVSEVARVEDVVDTTPPSAVAITGGAFTISEGDDGGPFGCQSISSCGTIVRLAVDVDAATDDHTPSDRMTYALFIASSESGATSSMTPDGFFVRDGTEIWRFGDEAEGDSDIWVAVAPIDLAGNVGPRSAAMQIHAASSGCRVAPGGSTTSTTLLVSMLALGLAWRSRRHR